LILCEKTGNVFAAAYYVSILSTMLKGFWSVGQSVNSCATTGFWDPFKEDPPQEKMRIPTGIIYLSDWGKFGTKNPNL
jgi:hypothetical protein